MLLPTALLLTLSIIVVSLTLFLVIINWKLWKISIGIYDVSVDLLRETILLREAMTMDIGELDDKPKR